jgi:hypothetical protein
VTGPGCGRVAACRPDPHQPGRERLARFGEVVWSRHTVLPHDRGETPLCTCRQYAVLCPYVRAARDILGIPVPWDPRRWPPFAGG